MEILERSKAKYQAELQKAIAEYDKLGNIIKHLEGAILACDEMIKEEGSKDSKDVR